MTALRPHERRAAWLLLVVFAWTAAWPRAVVCVAGGCDVADGGAGAGPQPAIEAVASCCAGACGSDVAVPGAELPGAPTAPDEDGGDRDCCIALDLLGVPPLASADDAAHAPDAAAPPLGSPWALGPAATGPTTTVVPRPPWVRPVLLQRATVVLTV